MATCYRHPNRETGVACSNCSRPICPDCMTPTPVGMRCPECARQRTKVTTARTMQSTGTPVTMALIAINVIAFLGELSGGGGGLSSVGGTVYLKGALFGPAISEGHQYYRLVTSGFLHAGFIHIFFNMYLLYLLGRLLEPAIGSVRFAAIYGASLLAGSFGALLVSPHSVTVGASGAVFGLMGAAFIELRHRGVDPMQAGIGGLIAINLVISFLIPGIAWGGHIGGLIGGGLAALALQTGDRYRSQIVGLAGCVVIAAVSVVAAISVAGGHGITG
jgi:membrane associated rhomboid family serine protease